MLSNLWIEGLPHLVAFCAKGCERKRFAAAESCAPANSAEAWGKPSDFSIGMGRPTSPKIPSEKKTHDFTLRLRVVTEIRSIVTISEHAVFA